MWGFLGALVLLSCIGKLIPKHYHSKRNYWPSDELNILGGDDSEVDSDGNDLIDIDNLNDFDEYDDLDGLDGLDDFNGVNDFTNDFDF